MAGVTRIQALKIFTIIVGAVILGVGLDSHFNSSWTKSFILPTRGGLTISVKPHELCYLGTILGQPEPCPSIAMEHYYISAIIICFSLSLAGLAASCLSQTDCSYGQRRTIDFTFHVVAALALLAAGIVYIISAHQIHEYVDVGEDVLIAKLGIDDWRRTEKMIAGALTILQAFIYGCVAVVIGRE